LLLKAGSLKGRKFMLFLSNLLPVGFQKLAVQRNQEAVLQVTSGLTILWQLQGSLLRCPWRPLGDGGGTSCWCWSEQRLTSSPQGAHRKSCANCLRLIQVEWISCTLSRVLSLHSCTRSIYRLQGPAQTTMWRVYRLREKLDLRKTHININTVEIGPVRRNTWWRGGGGIWRANHFKNCYT
jgi:hypothetical protein